MITAIILSVVSRNMVKGLTRKISFPLSFVIVWYLYYRAFVVAPSKLRCQRTFFNIQVIEKAQLATTKFYPTPWAFSRHAQTILLYMFSHFELWWLNPLRYSKELVPCTGPCSPQELYWVELDHESRGGRIVLLEPSRGDEVFVDSRSNPSDSSSYSDSSRDENGFVDVDPEYMNEPILLLIHGLGNDRHHIALQRYSRAAREAGWRVVIWEYTTTGVTDTVSLHAVINHIAARYPASPLCAIAWSLGSLYLIKYLTEVGKNTPLVCAISVSGCLSLLEAGESTRDNENVAYWYILANATKVALRRFLNSANHLSDQVRAKLSKHLETETDPLRMYDYFQFYAGENPQRFDRPYQYLGPTRNHYESLYKDVHKIGITTLVLHSSDDPMVSNHMFNITELARSSKYVISLDTRRGGHIAFYEGMLPFGKTWDLRISMQFISAVIESLAQVNHILTVIKRVDSSLGAKMSKENLLSSSVKTNQLPGQLARIVSSTSIFARSAAPVNVSGPPTPFNEPQDEVSPLPKWNK
jgi:predicted alpha/beta-fold hydrolase